MLILRQTQLHTAVKSIENDLCERLAKPSPNHSWRMCAELFGQDSSYIKSGLCNISAGWYPPGRSVSNHFCLTLMAADAYSSISIIHLSRRLYSGLTEANVYSTARGMHGRYSPAFCPSFIQPNTKWGFKSMQVWRHEDDRLT